MTLALSEAGQNGYSEGSPVSDMDWTELPPPEESPVPEPQTADTDSVPTEAPLCPVCNEPIIRDPSWKRMHKYHDWCKDKASASGAQTPRGSRTTGAGKAEKEADYIVSQFRSALVRGALLLAVVDRYDGFCVMVSVDSFCSNLRAILIQYDRLRKSFLGASAGGSVFGLVLSLLMMALPVAAHHKLIPSKHVTDMMLNLPFYLLRLSQQVQQSEQNLAEMMQDEMRKAREEKQKKEQATQGPDGAWDVTDVGPSVG